MAKKGTLSDFTLIWVFTVLGILIPFYLVLHGIIQKSTEVSLDTNNLEDHLLLNRVFYSTNSFFYNDPYTGRTNLEEVDISKFDEDTLKNLFGENAKIAMKIVLEGNEPIYYNENLYEFIEEIHAKSEKYDMIINKKIVLVKYPDGRKEKKLLIVNIGFEKK